MSKPLLVSLGEGVYSIAEVCRILQPGMTPRKVHYWLDTELLGPPLSYGAPGEPTLLTFEQLLRVRTVQHLRDELRFSLPRVRAAFHWILSHLFAPDWHDMRFAKGAEGNLIVRAEHETMVVPGGQRVIETALPELNAHVALTRRSWEQQTYVIPGFPHVVSNTRVQAGAPTIRGTRLETALIASVAEGDTFSTDSIAEILDFYPGVTSEAIRDALRFEGRRAAA